MSAPYRRLSLWLDQVADDGDALTPRPGLTASTDADVVVVGGGLTGLWTAYYLTENDPGLDVLVVEQEVVGFGASGRNGGWCSALFPASATTLAARHGEAAAQAMRAAMRDTVVEVAGVAAAEGIACDVAYGGTVVVARSAPQLRRARAEAAEGPRWGDETELLDADAARARLAATEVRGGTYTPDCAALQPARLTRGLAEVLEARGVRVVEHSRVVGIEPGRVTVEHLDATDDSRESGRRPARSVVRCRHVVRATEAWTPRLPGSRRAVVPVYSLMVATEPLPQDVWDAIGLRERETFADHRHLVVYGQRTADGRLAFGGRGAPYHWRSAVRPQYDREPRVFAALEQTLLELFPVLADVRVTHRWGGPLAIARDWHASVGLDRSSGLAWAGGYVGDGLSTTNLAGRTLADLLTDRDTELTRLPWVGHRSPDWEPEPLRWLGVNAGLRAMTFADREEELTGRPSVVERLVRPLLG
ncbi:FAD-dependent oxidoreductase [Actinotalea ferrariae CF5-4]|uniref:FAD-dependent oxidoreductase n=1 Tax=Actinotalea ferrariae CF5-4 TaxID=948458 RepID=A0A021VW71_9CELL|nr:FAD-dependent oxidoreductase [Actinotalea ferrariae]EYR64290.1 FAD-dependent oxidoreductase [Actinotalea ferrariae CF5-4]